MNLSKIQLLLTIVFISAFLFPNNTFAQKDKDIKKKVVIIKKTIDKDGNEKVVKTITEGKDIDIDELIKSAENEKGNVEVEVEVTTDGEISKTKSNEGKEVTVEVNGDEIKIMNGDEVETIKIQAEDGTQEIKTDDGKHIVIKRISTEGKEINVEELLEEVEVNIEEDATKKIRIIKMEGFTPDENSAFFGVMIDPSIEGMELLDVVEGSPAEKAGLQRGDILRNIDGTKINSYEELTNFLEGKKPTDAIVVVYDRDQITHKARVVLVPRGDVKNSKKMIWKMEDGEEIEIDKEKELHFHGKDKDGKVKQEKIIIKKKIKKEKE